MKGVKNITDWLQNVSNTTKYFGLGEKAGRQGLFR
jgi:hypothetical protein